MYFRKPGLMIFFFFFLVCPFLRGDTAFLSYQYVDSTASKVSYGWDPVTTKKIMANLEKLKAEVTKNPKQPLPWYNLANAYYEFRKLDEAEKCFIQALQLAPNFLEAGLGLAISYFDDKKYREAMSLYSDCLKLDPKAAGCINMIGNCYYQMKEYRYARDQYAIAAKFAQVAKFSHFNLGYMALKFDEKFEAQKEIEILAKIDKNAQGDLITEYNRWARKKQVPLYPTK